MQQKGRIKWIPKELIGMVNSIKVEKKIEKDSKAFKEIVHYAELGKTLEHIYNSIGLGVKRKR